MKQHIIVVLAIILTGMFVTTSCTGLSIKAKSFATLEATQITVHNAMNLYGSLVRAEKVHPLNQTTIDDNHALYRAAFDTALTAAQYDFTKATPESLKQISTVLVNSIAAIANSK